MAQKATTAKTADVKSGSAAKCAVASVMQSQAPLFVQGKLLQLQSRYGNAAIERMYRSGRLQAKLKIGQPGDKYEQEADSVADRVMSMPDSVVRLKPG